MNIRIFDTTLRDGEQSPGVSLSPEKKLNIAKKLDQLGVDAIETGFPVISDGEKEGVKLIVGEGLKAELCGLARTNKIDIDAAVDCGLNYIHTFIATSDIHLEHKLKMYWRALVLNPNRNRDVLSLFVQSNLISQL